MASIFHRVVTQFIGGTVAITGFTPARHPHGEPIGVMVATNGSFPFLDGWRSVKFPPQSTRVSSQSPRALRSSNKPVMGLSIWATLRAWPCSRCEC